MAFGLSTRGWPTLQNFADAARLYDNTPTMRDSDTRCFYRRGDTSKTIRKLTIGGLTHIILRYHQTDVVTYVEDGTIILQPWASKSTDTFATALLPSGIYTHFNHPIGYLVGIREAGENVYYNVDPNRTHLRLDANNNWRIDDKDIRPVWRYGINTKRFNAAKKETHLAEFMTWAKMYLTMVDVRPSVLAPLTTPELLERLATGTHAWAELCDKYGNSAIKAVRRAVIKKYECVETMQVYGMTYEEVAAVRRSQNQWSCL